MSRLYETLRRVEMQRGSPSSTAQEPLPVDLVNRVMSQPAGMDKVHAEKISVDHKARLVGITDPRGLAAEKFRALVSRLEHHRKERELKTLQITSAVANEGKTLVAGNLAVTLAKHTGSRVLLVGGDLHRPTLPLLFGQALIPGIGEWWSTREDKERILDYLRFFEEVPLWFLGAGISVDPPSQILQSARFAETFSHVASWFDWVVVDTPPMLPVVDANLWSRLVDGTLIVVREGVTPLRALRKGLDSLDNPKLVGMVLNEASEFDLTNYADHYYGYQKQQIPSTQD